jgi:hypothetical protein
MKTILAIVLLCLMSQMLWAQDIFITRSNPNDIDMAQCHANHYSILKKYADILDSQISLLAKGIHFEVVSAENPAKILEYKEVLIKLVIDRAIVKELTKQFMAVDFEATYGKNATNANRIKKVFDLDNFNINLELSTHSILEDAIEKHHHDTTFKNYVLHTLEHELVATAIKKLSVNSLKSIAKGAWITITTGKLATAGINGITTKTMLSFGHHVVEAAIVGAVVIMLAAPLTGARPSPVGIWSDILSENPAFIINPEWMNKLGSPDLPWETHCYAIQEHTQLMEKYLKRFIRNVESEFKSKIMSIHGEWEKTENFSDETLVIMTEKDATNTVIASPFQTSLPVWANGVVGNHE